MGEIRRLTFDDGVLSLADDEFTTAARLSGSGTVTQRSDGTSSESSSNLEASVAWQQSAGGQGIERRESCDPRERG
ncbi:hypothetical protein C1H46_037935 [Malus baccata]|uniref:Uncharacterized protein n=1 Tax=Malus baccata TaxID=106549 RepID=A0A540KA16_MALBA|nr:hypothetical protein C1H46_043413 [Malus baccata]TQD76520.1 hypothetical protein C1H46_037935 [Malus baccata]